MALNVASGLQLMIDGDALIKDEAIPLPERIRTGHVLEILQNTALEMINRFKTLGLEISSRFFASDTTRAEHGDLFVFVLIQARLCVLWEVAKTNGVWIRRAFEGANRDFVIVSSIDQ